MPSLFELIVSIEDPPDTPGAEALAIPLGLMTIGFLLYVGGLFNASIIFLGINRLVHNILHISDGMHLWKGTSKNIPIQHPFLSSIGLVAGLIGIVLLLDFIIPIAYHYLA